MNDRCVCASMNPGESVASPRSITSAPTGVCTVDPAEGNTEPETITTPGAFTSWPSKMRAAFSTMVFSWAEAANATAPQNAATRINAVRDLLVIEADHPPLAPPGGWWWTVRSSNEQEPDSGFSKCLRGVEPGRAPSRQPGGQRRDRSKRGDGDSERRWIARLEAVQQACN